MPLEVLQAQIDELRIDLDRGRALRRQWVGVAKILVVALVVTAAVKVKGTDLESGSPRPRSEKILRR